MYFTPSHTGSESNVLSASELTQARERAAAAGMDVAAMSDADLTAMILERARRFTEDAPTSAADAATIILDGVKADRWRILVGDDVTRLDRRVRADPERVYEPDFEAYAPD